MVTPGFTIDQLMEIAGLSVANAAHEYCKVNSLGNNAESRVLIFVGPGNNGGDGKSVTTHSRPSNC